MIIHGMIHLDETTHIHQSEWKLVSLLLLQYTANTLQWRHNGCDCVSNHQPLHCLLKRLFRWRSKKTSKPRITGLCEGNSPVTAEFPTQRANNAENVAIWWRHHDIVENTYSKSSKPDLQQNPHSTILWDNHRQVSNISPTSVSNKIVDHSDIVGASPVGAAPTTSSFLT